MKRNLSVYRNYRAGCGRSGRYKMFSFDGGQFCVTGDLFIKREIKSLLGKYAACAADDSGTEILFWHIVKMLELYGGPAKTVNMALEEKKKI